MARAINLELLNSLAQHDTVQVNTSSKENQNYTIEDATGFWIRKHRGTGWLVAVIEITLSLQIKWEHSAEQTQSRNLGLINEERDTVQQIGSHPKALVIVEADKLTPEWVAQTARYMARGEDSKLLVLLRENW